MARPYVTGISPKEGYPGTKVVIRGENLGYDESDLVAVKICGVDCTLRAKWEKESRITTYTGFCMGKGDIVVITRSGGVGTSSVGFQGLVKKNVGPYEEISIWVDEDYKSLLTGLKRTAGSELSHDNPLNISLDESSKFGADFIEKEFPNTSIDMSKENFNPMRFLLENYQGAKFEDLKSGLEYMKKNISAKTTNSSDNLLKNNISSFMDAIKIMKDIQWLGSLDKKNEFTRVMESMLKDILKTAHRIYDEDLESKDRADMIRNSLQILDTYKSMIYFSQNTDRYLKIDDYEHILTSYKLAAMQLSKVEQATPNSRLLTQIKNNLEIKVRQVQKHLLEKLVQFPSNPDDQRYLIEYYNALESLNNVSKKEGEEIISPAWYCLEEEKKWFIQLMIECRDMHIADEKVSLALKQSDTTDIMSKNSKQEQKLDSQKNDGQFNETTKSAVLSASDAAKIQTMTLVPHERNKFIEELCQMFFDIFTDYWRLGTMFINNLFTIPVASEAKSNSKSISNHSPEEFYKLVAEILETFCNIVRAAFIPHTFQKVTDEETGKKTISKNLLLPWPIQHDAEIISQILPHCLKVARMCAMQIHSLDLPPQQFENVKNLIYDLRCECLIHLLSTPTREIASNLGFEEQDWILDRDLDGDNNCLITNLPFRFEAKFNRALTLSKEYVLDDRKGEKMLFKDSEFVKKIALLLYGILHAFLKRIRRFMTKEDTLPKFVHISRSKLLIYLFNNLTICRKKVLPNIWNVITQHKYLQIDQVIKESKKNVKELQDLLLKQYILETIGPIVENIEPNLYAGRFDFNDCSPPTNVRNYVKLIIMSLLNLHSELFLLNKSLILAVFTYAVKEIYTKILELFQNIPQFCQQAAIQTYVDIFCLRETFKLYSSDESKDLMQKILKLIPSNSFEQNKALMTKLISEFQKSMQPYIVVFQQQPPQSTVTVSFLNDTTAINNNTNNNE